jgi:hypothetical protein
MDQDNPANTTPVRLTRKYAEVIDGVDLSGSKVGDRLELSSRDARLLIAEGWASLCPSEARPGAEESARKTSDEHQPLSKACDSSRVRGS